MGSGGLVAPCQEEVFGAGRAIALLMTAETLRHDTCNVSSGRPGSLKARNLRRDPRMALSIAPADNPFQPVVVRGRVEEWLDGERRGRSWTSWPPSTPARPTPESKSASWP